MQVGVNKVYICTKFGDQKQLKSPKNNFKN